jgi:imidazolonepropionase-like amidohydrolase
VIRYYGLYSALPALLAASAAFGQQPASRSALAHGAFAITNVNVIPMTSETVLRDQTVLVRDGRITRVAAAASVTVPAGTVRIDGRGKYVMPGLADMHAHLYADGPVPDSAAPAELGVFLAHGITTVRLMIGTPQHLQLRGQIESGALDGPQLWIASPHFTTEASDHARVVKTPEDVRTAVREVKAAGYDFVKITFGIIGPLYEALVDEAAKANIRVVGHVEPEVGVRRAIAAGQQIEHLDAYFEGALRDDAPMRKSVTQYGVYQPENWASLQYIDDAKLDSLAVLTARSGVWSVPTLEIFNRAFSIPLTDSALHALPDWQLIPNVIRGAYVRSRDRYWAQPVPRETRARFAEIRGRLTKRIADAGGKLMVGSDSPDLLMAYGYAMHRELEAMVRAGLTPYQVLRAATRNAAEFLNATQEWGTIEVGKRADLILLSANPLENISHTQRIEAVSIGGHVLERADLEAMIVRARKAIDGAAIESKIFEPDNISGSNVYRGSFTPDGGEFYYFKRTTTDPRREEYRIFVSRRTGDRWSAPDTVDLGGAHSDLYPAITPDGSTMFFSSYRPAPGDTSTHASANLWRVRRSANRWQNPELVRATRFGHYHSQLLVDDAGDLHFAVQTHDYRGKLDAVSRARAGYASADTSAAWRYWETNLPRNMFLFETAPGHDASYVLLMVAPRDEAGRPAGNPDIWVAFHKDGRWSSARPLQGVNSSETENFPFYSADRNELFFVRQFREFRHIPLNYALGPRPNGF